MPKRILLVDDDAELCREVSDILKGEGYSVDYLSGVDELEKTIMETEYDIILIDFKMPHADGIDVLRNVIKKSAGSKIFVTTGRPFIENLLQEQGLLNQVSGIFSKPFDVQVMLQKIAASTDLIPPETHP